MTLCCFVLPVCLPALLAAQQIPPRFVRPPRFVPPVHARPLQRPQWEQGQAYTGQSVRQVSGVQQFNDAPSLDFNEPAPHYVAEEWRTRQPVNAPGVSAPPTGQSTIQPSLHHPSPQSMQAPGRMPQPVNGGWQDLSAPDPPVNGFQQVPAGNAATSNAAHPAQQAITTGQPGNWSQSTAPPMDSLTIENNHVSYPAQNDLAVEDEIRNEGPPRSVLVRSEPEGLQAPAAESAPPPRQSAPAEPNQLRQNRASRSQFQQRSQPLRNSRSARYRSRQSGGQGNALPANNTTAQSDQSRGRKSCDEYRAQLLNTPITDIILDTSPLRPSDAALGAEVGSRTWTDCRGETLGQGKLTGIERSYALIEDDFGNTQRIPLWRLSDGDVAAITNYWALPTECSLGCDEFEGRNWACNAMLWKASSLCHKPLYFENRQLERYGHTHGPIIEPVHTAAHFFSSLIFWPYQTAIHPHNECVYALGYYRPGDCAPWLKDPVPLSLRGASRQALAITGAAAIIP